MPEEGIWLYVQASALTQREINRRATDLAVQEAANIQKWWMANDDQRKKAETAVRAALIRLLETPYWMSGAVDPEKNVLEIRVQLDAAGVLAERGLSEHRAMLRNELEAQMASASLRLRLLRAELEADA